MKIVVLVKQVPATDNVKMDEETGTMIRDGIESEVNPLDLYAIEEAVRIKERIGEGVEINVLSMGPKKAVEAVRSAIAIGCDKGYLLSDRKFAGSDTWVTAYALSTGITKLVSGFDLILCGERATDGETGQVGPEVGAYLGLPALTYVSKIEEIGNGKIIAHRAVEGGHEVVESPLPVLVSVVKEINTPRMPNFSGKMKAKKIEIPLLTAEDIGADEERLGLQGSPTRVVKIFRPQVARKGKIVSTAGDPDGAVSGLVDFLTEKTII
ncbi:MAG: electron transfer flavoprotein subunit beta [Deltaproteobacteria bacterium RBG_13_43_22]|nr:MAG: electron transfer flavoprotein subunit beta [Deltaproteobacteria bacterium RBG_13_43_22]